MRPSSLLLDGQRLVARCSGQTPPLLSTARCIRLMPSVVEPAFEFLQPVVNFAQDALDGCDRRVADGCCVKKKDESGKVARDQDQLINVLDLDRNQSR